MNRQMSTVPRLRLLLGLASILLAAGCDRTTAQPRVKEQETGEQAPWFEDVTAAMGLDFTHDPGPIDGEYLMPQIHGSGAALFDMDNDGRLDIYLLQGGGPKSTSKNRLFHQLPTGKFHDESAGSGLDFNGLNTGVAIGDVNNDGFLDVLTTQYLGARLCLNQQNSTFKDVTESSGISNPYWGASTSFFDFDRDGWLDLVIVNYVDFDESRYCTFRGGRRDYCRPQIFQGTATRLFHNRGCDDAGTWLGYEDRTDASGVGKKLGPGLGVYCADFNGDDWPDIFVANDIHANHLWINQRNGVFTEEAISRGLAFNARGEAVGNMGVAYGDVDGDGLADIFVTLFTNEHHGLWQQSPRGLFQERTIASGLTKCKWHGTGWGTVLADFDHDGDLDLALVNGFLDRRDVPSKSFFSAYMDRNQLFVNEGGGKFRDVSTENSAFCGELNVGRGLCVGDIDGDGALDLLVTQVGGPARILRNVSPKQGHWLIVRAFDPNLKREAIGAEVRLRAGERTWQGMIQPGSSFQCSNDSRAHFGLGAVEQVEAIDVLWPDGVTERFSCRAVDCLVEVQRGKGEPVSTRPGDGP